MPGDELSPQTVYILGAGFSREAQVPLQDEILDSIRNFDLSDAPSSMVNRFLDAWSKSSAFLERVFGASRPPSLEDVFTLLDEAVNGRQHWLGKSWQELYEIGRALSEAILYLFHLQERDMSQEAEDFYRLISSYFIEQRLAAGQHGHPFSIISLNWDSVLDSAIYECLTVCQSGAVDLDYSCYSTPIPEAVGHTPSITQKSRGLYNIKVMKLHGSTNWLLCPSCNRLYVGLGSPTDIWMEYILGRSCPRCKHIQSMVPAMQSEDAEAPTLEPFLITPTFVKKFENPHIRMVWHNACVDLCEAGQVVFIGYSLREADYHLRTLFRRAIRPDARITVVLAPGDDPENAGPVAGDKNAAKRYEEFFGAYDLAFDFRGVSGYFKALLGPQPLDQRMAALKNQLNGLPK